MTVIKLNEITDDFRLIKPGTYDGVITNAKHNEKAPGEEDPMVQWILSIEIDPGDGQGKVTIPTWLSWYAGGLKMAWQNAQIILDKRIPLDEEFDDEDYIPELMGRTVRVVVGHNPYNGEVRNSVERFLRLNSAAPATSSPASARKKSSTGVEF